MAANHVIGVIGDHGAASKLTAALQQAGYADAELFTGEQGATEIQELKGSTGIFGAIVGAVQSHLSEQTNYVAQYEEEARNGNIVVAVEVPGSEEAGAAQALLERHGAQNIRYFGTLAVADMTPETNPSAPNEGSAEVQAKAAEGEEESAGLT